MTEKKTAQSIFEFAVDLPPSERNQYIEQACGSNAALLKEVQELLSFADDADDDSFGFEPPRTDAGPDELIGATIGNYTLRSVIGEGGFGVVYLADQTQPVKRRVAIKIIKLGMDSKAVVARFESERQALALMDHPGVARIFDGGTTQVGRPYFVMELVEGVPITKYCDTHTLPLNERIALFRSVCDAIQHAHQKGVIHRDLKPSNILVEYQDAQPVVKVIDFGIAKALNQELTEQTFFTESGQLIGTPEYMSPEQAEMSALNVDTRTDVYSLGILLYELLSGGLPFDSKSLRAAGIAEIQRIIREEEPPRPSTRYSSVLTSSQDESSAIARARDVEARSLPRSLRGDLDWITMKCLEKDRSRRYDSPSALSQDLHRHLSDQPVEAGPPTFRYRAGKAYRRNRKSVLVTAIFAPILLGTLITTSIFALMSYQTNKMYDFVNDYQAAVLRDVVEHAKRDGNPKIAYPILESAMKRAKDAQDFIGQEAYLNTLHKIAKSYAELGDRTRAEEVIEIALDVVAQTEFPSATDQSVHFLIEMVRFDIIKSTGSTEEVISQGRRILALLETLSKVDSALRLPQTASANHSIAMALVDAGEKESAAEHFKAAFAAYLESSNYGGYTNGGRSWAHMEAIMLARLYNTLVDEENAFYWGNRALEMAIEFGGQTDDAPTESWRWPLARANSMDCLADSQALQGFRLDKSGDLHGAHASHAEAVRLSRDSVQSIQAHQDTITKEHQNYFIGKLGHYLNALSIASMNLEEDPVAIEQCQESLALVQRAGGSAKNKVIVLRRLGKLYLRTSQIDEAMTVATESLRISRGLESDLADQTKSLMLIGKIHAENGSDLQALEYFQEALATAERHFGRDNAQTLDAVFYTAGALHQLKRYDEALAYSERHAADAERIYGSNHWETLLALSELPFMYLVVGEVEKSVQASRVSFQRNRDVHGPDHEDTLSALMWLTMVTIIRDSIDDPLSTEAHFAKQTKDLDLTESERIDLLEALIHNLQTLGHQDIASSFQATLDLEHSSEEDLVNE